MLENLLTTKGFALDCETTSTEGKKKSNLHFKTNRVVCISFSSKEHSFTLMADEIFEKIDIFRTLMGKNYMKIGHNLKFDLKSIYGTFGIVAENLYFDTHIAACLINESEKHGLKELAKKYLKLEWGEWKDQEDIDALKEYCRMDSYATFKLAELQIKTLQCQKLYNLFKTEMEVLNVFYNSEITGIPIELSVLDNLSQKYGRYIQKIIKWIYAHTQEEFNINSPDQLAHVLFDLKKLPILKKTPGGKASTDTQTLKLLSRDKFRFVDAILLYRHWEMLVRHIDKLRDESIEGRIYPTFNTIGAETGRFSCKEPNLQQIPSKTRESLAIRKAFAGNLLVADYSNVELRLLAHFTRDPKLLEVYRPGGSGDLHAKTAELLGISRSHAKTINFGIGYGMGPRKLSEDLNIPESKAKEYIDAWYRTYALVEPWKKMIINTTKKYGYVNSIGGRKRRIDFSKLKYNEVWGAEREAVNFVIQGSSADITKLAIAALKDERILIQVHDELVINMDYSKRTLEEIKSIMENVVQLRVPLIADAKLVRNWGEAK